MSKTTEDYTFSGYLGPEFQSKLIWQILTEPEFALKIIPQLQVTYFDDPTYKRMFIVISEYTTEFGKAPNLQNKSIDTAIMKYKIEGDATDELILRGVVDHIKNWNDRVLNKNLDFDGDVIQRESFLFIKQQEYRRLAEYIHGKIKTGDIKSKATVNNIEQKIKDINNIGDEEDYGIEVFEDIERALRKEFREPIPTGISAIDVLMGGGLGRGEIGIVLAPSGYGKSTILTKIANSALECNKNVLQIIFEDTEDQIRRKHFTIWSDIPLEDIDDNRDHVYNRVVEHNKTLTGKLIIKKFSQENTTIPDIRHWMERYQKKFGIRFDVIVLDYLDCVEPHKKSVDTTHAELTIIKAFEAMAGDYNIPCWSALQTNRSGFDAEFVSAQQMGGNIKRAQKTHFLMSIAKTPDQKEGNLANISIIKARFAKDGQQFRDCIFNNGTMEIAITDSVRKIDLEQHGEKPVDVEKINKMKKVEDVPKEEIKLDVDAQQALGNLLNLGNKEDNRDSDIKNFLDQKAGNQDVMKEEKK